MQQHHAQHSPHRRPRARTGRAIVLGVTAAVAMLGGSQAAHAQPMVSATAGVSWSSVANVNSASIACGNGALAATILATTSCGGGPSYSGIFVGPPIGSIGAFASQFTGAATATSIAGTLRGSSSVSWFIGKDDDQTPYPSVDALASSWAQWSDQAGLTPLSASAPAVSAMNITFQLTGSISNAANITYPIVDLGTGGLVGMGLIGTQTGSALFMGSATGGSFYDTGFDRVGNNAGSDPIGGLYVLHVGVASLLSDPFTVALATGAAITIGGAPMGAFSGGVTSDFSHTALPIGYQLLDANGSDVTSQYTVSFANGMQIGATAPPITATPEPATLALLGTGLFGVAFASLRRRTA